MAFPAARVGTGATEEARDDAGRRAHMCAARGGKRRSHVVTRPTEVVQRVAKNESGRLLTAA